MANEGVTEISVTEVTYHWKIKNFRLNGKKHGEYISSPTFSDDSCEGIQWALRCYPREMKNYWLNRPSKTINEMVLLELVLVESNQSVINAEVELSILDSRQERLNILHKFVTFDVFISSGGPWELIEGSKLVSGNYLVDHHLTIRCKIRAGLTLEHSWGVTKVNSTERFFFNLQELSTNLEILMEEQNFGDVTFDVDGHRISAHKAILSARSPVFSALFSQVTREKQENLITLQGITSVAFKEVLRFIYTGKVNDLDSTAYELLSLSDKYKLDSLKRICEDCLSRRTTANNAISLLFLSDIHSAKTLKVATLNFIRAHIASIMDTEDYKMLEEQNSVLIKEIFRFLVTSQSSIDECSVESGTETASSNSLTWSMKLAEFNEIQKKKKNIVSNKYENCSD